MSTFTVTVTDEHWLRAMDSYGIKRTKKHMARFSPVASAVRYAQAHGRGSLVEIIRSPVGYLLKKKGRFKGPTYWAVNGIGEDLHEQWIDGEYPDDLPKDVTFTFICRKGRNSYHV